MIEIGNLLLAAGGRQHARRKVFDVVGALAGGREDATRVAAELSDALRWIETQGMHARLLVHVLPRSVGVMLRLTLLWKEDASTPAPPRPAALQRGDASEPGRAVLQYLLRQARAGATELDRARAALVSQSREELFMSLEASNRALQASHSEVRLASEAKAQFLANMSHEIRTPMNAIVGMNRLALSTDLSPRQRGYLEKIETSARHLLGIVDDVLDVSKIEAGKLTLERGELSITRVLDDVTDLAGMACAEKGLTWRVRVADDVPGTLRGDPLRLRQVLVNLVGNAVKFTEVGEVGVDVELVDAPAGDASARDAAATNPATTDANAASGNAAWQTVTLRFTVRDTGIGLSLDERERLFQAFSQADVSITRKYGGTGLGLTISRSLVEMMDGEISVESELGRGSQFTFTARFELPDPRVEIRVLRPDLHGRRVLVADQHTLTRGRLRQMLEAMGLSVVEATGGRAALAQFKANPFELLFVDWQMADLDGVEVAARVRRANSNGRATRRNPGIFLTTAYGAATALGDSGRGMLDGVLAKPIDASVLFEAVAAWFGMDTARAGARSGARTAGGFDRHGRILVVEDNRLNQEVAVGLLNELGLETCLAGDGAQALALLRAGEHVDLVLMDMQMPVMDGLQATRAIRGDPALKHLPVVAMTANALASDHAACLAAGMNAVVTKPVDPDALEAALRAHLPAHPQRRQNATTREPAAGVAGLPRNVPGLDVERGLRFTRGRHDLYQQILTGFLEDQRALPEQLQAALDAGDAQALARLAHTLRGLASGLGATRLAEAGEALESLVREAPAPPPAQAVRQAVGRVVDEHRALYQALRA